MFLPGFFRHVIPMVLCLAGLYLFTVRRERCQGKFFLCMVITLAFEYVIYYFMLSGDVEIQGVPAYKILSTLMISFLIFSSGLCVYEGWYRVGIYIFFTDLLLAISERLYWTMWEYFTHRSMDWSIIYFKGNTASGIDALNVLLPDSILMIPCLVASYKLRRQPLRPVWLFKTVVIAYLVLGASPLIGRPGFSEGSEDTSFIILLVWLAMLFLMITSINVTAARENRRILYLRKQVVEEQSRLLMIQKEKVRRLRHDVKKHLSNLDYILGKNPSLRTDPALLRYQEKLNANEKWMQGVLYCDSPVLNICFEQMGSYCEDRGIRFDTVLKRLNCYGWTQEDQLTFGALLINLIQRHGDTRSVSAVRCTGDCLMGQNILRIALANGTGDRDTAGTGDRDKAGTGEQNAAGFILGSTGGTTAGQKLSGPENAPKDWRKDKKKKRTKERKLISNLEKDIRLVLSNYEGNMSCEDNGGSQSYVFSWKDMKAA